MHSLHTYTHAYIHTSYLVFSCQYYSTVVFHLHMSSGGMSNSPLGDSSSDTQSNPIDMNNNDNLRDKSYLHFQ
jgi:hypothetical protein